MDLWLGNRKRVSVLNREDMISTADCNAWATYLSRQGMKVFLRQLGMGTMKLGRLAKILVAEVDVKCRAKGWLSRPVRIGYPNVGKSPLINRLLEKRITSNSTQAGAGKKQK